VDRRGRALLDGSTGQPRGRAMVEGDRRITPGGELCGATDKVIWCGPIRGDHIRPRWSKPGTGAAGIDIHLGGDHLVVTSFDKTVVHRLSDGQLSWQRPGHVGIWVHADKQHLFMLGERSLDVVGLMFWKASRWCQAVRPSAASTSTTMIMACGASTRWNAAMFTATGAISVSASGTKRPATSSSPAPKTSISRP
jgi:hypothetical protein